MKANTKSSTGSRLAQSFEVICLVLAVMFSGTGGVALASALASPAFGLGSAASFEVLGGSTVTNTGASVVAGDLGVAPGTTITGFPPGSVTEGGVTHAGDALALQAQSDVALAYNSSAGQPCNTHLDGQELGGKTLTPDVYCFSSLAQLTGQLVLDAQGNTAAVWIIQIPGGLSTASNSSVVVTNGGGVCNVFWIVGESATIGANSSFAGNILALTSITLATGANLSGRALSRNGAVTLDTNTISKAPCSQAPTPTPVPVPTHVISASPIPTPALVPTVVRAPVVIPVTGADLGDARVPVAAPPLSVSLGLLSLGFLSLGMGLILFAVRRK
jgi:hypothetical protein